MFIPLYPRIFNFYTSQCGCFLPDFWTINSSKIVTTSSFRVSFSLDSWFVGFSFAVHFFAHTFGKRRRFLLKSSDWSRKLGFAFIRCLEKDPDTFSQMVMFHCDSPWYNPWKIIKKNKWKIFEADMSFMFQTISLKEIHSWKICKGNST